VRRPGETTSPKEGDGEKTIGRGGKKPGGEEKGKGDRKGHKKNVALGPGTVPKTGGDRLGKNQ